MDRRLLTDYRDAVAARPLVARLPPGLREYARRYETLLLEDLRAQAGRVVSEAEALAAAPAYALGPPLRELLPVLWQVALALAKKHWPAAAASGAASAIATYLATKGGM